MHNVSVSIKPERPLAWWLTASIGVFVLVSSLALLGAFQHLTQRQEERAFASLTASNVKFLRESNLPRSRDMEIQLGAVMDAEVRFVPATMPIEDGQVTRARTDLSVAYILGPNTLVHFRRTDQGGLTFLYDGRTWLALCTLWFASLGLGGWLANGLTNPLYQLTQVLPAIGGTDPLPALPVNRKDEVGLLARTLESTHQTLRDEREKRRAAERLALLGRMTASLAHEVRNPIAAIRMHAQLLEGAPEHESEASRRLIESEAERIEALVNQWMRFARPEPPTLVEGDLADLVTQACERIQAQANHAKVMIKMTRTPLAMPVRLDRDRMLQALTNLMLNATQAQSRGGELSLSFASDVNEHQVIIEDQGPGFSAEALQHFGEPFFSEKEGGMGLGVAVALEIVEAHGGTLTAENLTPIGARICLSLPAHRH
jgi:signal transduction histidine kinase